MTDFILANRSIARNVKEAALILNVSKMTIYRWAESKKLSPIRVGQIYFHINELTNLKRERSKNG